MEHSMQSEPSLGLLPEFDVTEEADSASDDEGGTSVAEKQLTKAQKVRQKNLEDLEENFKDRGRDLSYAAHIMRGDARFVKDKGDKKKIMDREKRYRKEAMLSLNAAWKHKQAAKKVGKDNKLCFGCSIM